MEKVVALESIDILLCLVGEYAVTKGEEWRTGEGAEIMDAYEAAIDSFRKHQKASAILDDTAEVLAEYIATKSAFRNRPIGAPGSPVRLNQEAEIELEDRARAVVLSYLASDVSTRPTAGNGPAAAAVPPAGNAPDAAAGPGAGNAPDAAAGPGAGNAPDAADW